MLNTELYLRLRRIFGTVKVSKENEPAQTQPYRTNKGIEYRSIGGEEYNVCCPFCHDTGFHLYINYNYGEETYNGRRNYAVANCFHGCLKNRDNRKALYDMLFSFPMGHRVASVVVPIIEDPEPDIVPPGKLILISQLPEDHPAVQYLVETRKFPLPILDYYGVCYCYESKTNPFSVGRIVIPIWFKGEYKGWQTRSLVDKPKGAKYFTAPGMKKSKVIYNYDVAINQDHVVICEGVTDVWRVGPAGVCLFGKSASLEQIRLIKDGWKDKDICLLLDPDASAESSTLFEKLSKDCKNVCVVNLPEGVKDAALMDYLELQKLIKESRDANKGHPTNRGETE